jgi:hypothetical protein
MISVWERGELHSRLDQALLLLQAGQPEDSLQELARLSVGERDRRLVQMRQETIGRRFFCSVECPWCKQDLQFEFETSQILQGTSTVENVPATVTADDYSVTFRLPNTEDLMEALRTTDSADQRRRLLVTRCVSELRNQYGASLDVGNIPEPLLSKLCDLVGSCDPMADVQFSVLCVSCDKSWQAPFDVASFFWKEIAIRARRVLSEVHVLASAYGWNESDILRMSAARREFYLEMVSA